MGVFMSFLQRLFRGVSEKPQKRYHTFSVKCMRCGEVIEGRIDLDNELSVEYEDGRDVYHGRKVLMGSRTCFQRLDAEFTFTYTRELIGQHVTGGEFV
jgi:hypothetical protein